MKKSFSFSNTTLKNILTQKEVLSILITTRVQAGFISTHNIDPSDFETIETQLSRIPAQYKSKRLRDISILTKSANGTINVWSILSTFPNGKVAIACKDYLSTISDNELRHQFKNAEELITCSALNFIEDNIS